LGAGLAGLGGWPLDWLGEGLAGCQVVVWLAKCWVAGCGAGWFGWLVEGLAGWWIEWLSVGLGAGLVGCGAGWVGWLAIGLAG
jgi:hypothetical protein